MKMYLFSSLLTTALALSACLTTGCGKLAETSKPVAVLTTNADSAIAGPGKPVYDLSKPVKSIELKDPELIEISGLSTTDQPGVLLAIADEAGEVFFLQEENGSVSRRLLFRDRGDFEGIEYAHGVIYALKSDGTLFEIKNWESGQPEVNFFDTGLSKSNDVEGLGFDPSKNALLLACKEDPESNVDRKVFAFDLDSKQLGQIPVYTINPAGVDRLMPLGPEDKKHAFSTSAIAVHPFRQEVYLLSTALKRMLVLDAAGGQILLVYRIDKKIIPQPEGIAFDPQGNLFISSEGKNGNGRLLRFNYHGSPPSFHSKH